MPTSLPSRRPFWRRHAPAPETVRDALATVAEFALALAVVTFTVMILTHVDLGLTHTDRGGVLRSDVLPDTTPIYAP